ncbi:MAG: hypothetical protein Q8M95_12540, partial [Candidatus Methanoperedens sp.]|nr:hypothetical protein [Candidatus Methanoperedens sp.]
GGFRAGQNEHTRSDRRAFDHVNCPIAFSQRPRIEFGGHQEDAHGFRISIGWIGLSVSIQAQDFLKI